MRKNINTLLLDQLKKNSSEGFISFHVPGHKSGKLFDQFFIEKYYRDIATLDLTELPDTDNLHDPQSVIKEAQDRAAKVFNSDKTFFVVNGTSASNISAMMAILNPNDKVIVPRDCHKSIQHGLIMGGYIPIYVSPEVNKKWNIPAGISPEVIEKAILDNPEVKAVVLTYPNYYGVGSDIEAIVNVVHKYDKVLIVDEAHGAHFILSEVLPIPSLNAGADIVTQSTHKTLPAFTQSSMLHLKSQKINVDRLKLMLTMNQSSSPSFLLMASLDIATNIIDREGKDIMNKLLENIDIFHKELSEIRGVRIINEEMIGKSSVKFIDKTRLVISMEELGLKGFELSNILRGNYGIQMEMYDLNNVVGVSTIGNNRKDFEKLIFALSDISRRKEGKKVEGFIPQFYYKIPQLVIPPREAAFSITTPTEFQNSEGKVSGEYIIPYPPGIPILCPGEAITKEIIEYTNYLQKNGVEIIGFKDKNLKIINIIE